MPIPSVLPMEKACACWELYSLQIPASPFRYLLWLSSPLSPLPCSQPAPQTWAFALLALKSTFCLPGCAVNSSPCLSPPPPPPPPASLNAFYKPPVQNMPNATAFPPLERVSFFSVLGLLEGRNPCSSLNPCSHPTFSGAPPSPTASPGTQRTSEASRHRHRHTPRWYTCSYSSLCVGQPSDPGGQKLWCDQIKSGIINKSQ